MPSKGAHTLKADHRKLKQAVRLRLAGWTLAAISEKTSLSPSTLQRHFKRLDVKRSSLSIDSIDQAKQNLLQDTGFVEELKYTIAASIVDDLAIVKKIRESLTLAVEELAGDALTPAALKSRALAALSTSLSITQAVNRKALNLDKFDPFVNEENLPKLTIYKMTDEDIEAVGALLIDGDE